MKDETLQTVVNALWCFSLSGGTCKALHVAEKFPGPAHKDI